MQQVYINQMFDFFKKIVNYPDQQQVQNKEIATQILLENATNLQTQAQDLISTSQKIIRYEQKINSKIFTQEEVSQLTNLYSNIIEYYAQKNNDEMCKKFTDKIHGLLKLPRVNSVLIGKKSCYDQEKKIFKQNFQQCVKQVEAIVRVEQQALIKNCLTTRKIFQEQINKQDVRLKARIQNRSKSKSKSSVSKNDKANDSQNKKEKVISPNKNKTNKPNNNPNNQNQKPPAIPKSKP